MWSDSARTRSGSGGDDGLGEVNLDSRVSERLAARRSAVPGRCHAYAESVIIEWLGRTASPVVRCLDLSRSG